MFFLFSFLVEKKGYGGGWVFKTTQKEMDIQRTH